MKRKKYDRNERPIYSRIVFSLIVAVILGFTAVHSFGQDSELDYNDYYRYPFSIGAEYQNLTPFAEYGGNYNIYDISAHARWPLFKTPVFIPTARLGMMRFDSQDLAEPEKWDHRYYYATLGMMYTNRFSKNFEIGGEVAAGYAMGVFPNLVPEEGSLGSSNLLFEVGGRIGLNPSYNFSIDINPNLKYLYSPGALDDFNGLILGIGFSAHYRFGKDPDAAGSVIRSLKFEQVEIPSLFAAMQSYYARNPIGRVVIRNTENHGIEQIEISFYQAGYMDSPTPARVIEELGAGESVEVELFASYNEEVFRTEGITPLSGEIIATYKTKGRGAEQRQAVSYDLHDKTALVWDDDRKVAAYITPADSALRNYASFIRQANKDAVIAGYSDTVQYGIQAYHALAEVGCLYQADPSSPFTAVQGNPMVVDSISLPRDTLKRITGDCDDLTVLYNSLLETVGIETGFITVPGHIYSAFNTKVLGRDYRKVHPDREMTINVEGELWVPVEITMVGVSDFNVAWRQGMEEWKRYEGEAERRGFYRTRASQEVYRAVGLKETDLGLQYGEAEEIERGFRRDMGDLVDVIVSDYLIAARESGKKEEWNRLGITYAQFSQYGKAEDAFRRALREDANYLSAKINLGNVAYLRGNYRDALGSFEDSYAALKRKGLGDSPVALKVLLNISKANFELKRYDDSKSYYEMAASIDEESTQRYSYLGSVAGGDDSRAAAAGDSKTDILFIDEE